MLFCMLTAVKLGSVTPRLTRVIERLGTVGGVASLDDQVFVVHHHDQHVEVYSAINFVLKRHITVPCLGRIQSGIATCSVNHCLYVSEGGYIHRIQLSGAYNVIKGWFVNQDATGISVNSNQNVIVACYTSKTLQEYTTLGELLREICPLIGEMWPWHAVQLSSGHYAVSVSHVRSPGVVSIVAEDGQVVRSTGGSRIATETLLQQLKSPRTLVITQNNTILVTDKDNSRILLLNSSLSRVQELILPVDDGIQCLIGLCLDESRGRLYVGGRSQGKSGVFVFDI